MKEDMAASPSTVHVPPWRLARRSSHFAEITVFPSAFIIPCSIFRGSILRVARYPVTMNGHHNLNLNLLPNAHTTMGQFDHEKLIAHEPSTDYESWRSGVARSRPA